MVVSETGKKDLFMFNVETFCNWGLKWGFKKYHSSWLDVDSPDLGVNCVVKNLGL